MCVQVCVVKIDGFSVVELELHPCRSVLCFVSIMMQTFAFVRRHISTVNFTKPDLLYGEKKTKTLSDSQFSHLFSFA